MAKVLTFKVPRNAYKKLKAILKMFHEEIAKSREVMKRDQAEIEGFRAESREIKKNADKLAAESKIMLDELSHRILKRRKENSRILVNLEREKMALRLENEMLKFERRLPQGKDLEK